MMYWDGHGGGGWVVAMIVMMVLFWGSIVALGWMGIRAMVLRTEQPGSNDGDEPRDILAMRLAQDEIEPEEFERRLALLDAKR